MNHAPTRSGATFLLAMFAAGCGLGLATAAHAQTVSDPTVTVGKPADNSAMLHTDAKGRHLAPHDAFYLLEYVSAKTDKGVEGFEPGQEVHLVEVHRPTHTLVVSNGRAQVEVSPSKLTNDMDMAALARAKDQANQSKLAAYVQAEEAEYQKHEKEAADATAKDLQNVNREQAVASTVGTSTQTDQPAQPTDATSGTSTVNAGYYGAGGYGYGSPYGYFGGGGETVVVERAGGNRGGPSNGAAPAPAAAAPAGKVAAPAGGAGGGRAK